MGKITLNKEPGRRITFKEELLLAVRNLKTKMILNILLVDYNPIILYGHIKFIYLGKLFLPMPYRKNVDYNNRTVAWKYDTRKMWHKQELMSVELRKDFPWLLLVIGVIVLILLTFLVHWILRFPKKSHWLERIKHTEDAEKK